MSQQNRINSIKKYQVGCFVYSNYFTYFIRGSDASITKLLLIRKAGILLNKILCRQCWRIWASCISLTNKSPPNIQNTGSLFIYNARALKCAFDRLQSVLSIKLTTISGTLKNFNLAPNYSWSILKCCIGIELRREELGSKPISGWAQVWTKWRLSTRK